MNTPDGSTGAPGNPETPSVDMLARAKDVVELINMAAESGIITREAGNAISWGCIHAQQIIDQAKAALEMKLEAA